MCVAEDREALAALKAASVAAEWELAAGATELRAALDQVDAERPQVMVAFGDQRELVRIVHDRFPAMRIVVDRDTPGATAVATSLEDVRGLVVGLPRPGGPVGA
jgi:hypothetical protein